MPAVQANAVCGADLLLSKRGDVRGPAYVQIARRVVQELHESSVLGIHLAEFLAGVVGAVFALAHSDLFCDEYL